MTAYYSMGRLLVYSLLLNISFKLTLGIANNACKTFPDYYKDLQHNPNCFYNPDVDDSVQQMIKRHGYPFQNYTVTTEDGYILSIFRIPYGKNSTDKKIGQPIFLAHGIGGSSVLFVFMGNKSLAFNLADDGYDVWLANFRGCRYSNRHLTLNDKQKRYWNFTLSEVGIYDVPAQIDLVIQETQQKIIYIGYSMGTTAYFIYSSEFSEVASQKIKLAISLAPIAKLGHATTPARAIINVTPLYDLVKGTLSTFTDGALMQRTPGFMGFLKTFCQPYPAQVRLCSLPYSLLFGYDPKQDDPETYSVTFLQGRDAIGVLVLIHYTQMLRSRKFQKFDYGLIGNLRVYGTNKPPEYNLTKINIINYFIRGAADPLATAENTRETYIALPKSARPFKIYVVEYKQFTHLDFVQARDVKPLVNDHIIDFLNRQNTPKRVDEYGYYGKQKQRVFKIKSIRMPKRILRKLEVGQIIHTYG